METVGFVITRCTVLEHKFRLYLELLAIGTTNK